MIRPVWRVQRNVTRWAAPYCASHSCSALNDDGTGIIALIHHVGARRRLLRGSNK